MKIKKWRRNSDFSFPFCNTYNADAFTHGFTQNDNFFIISNLNEEKEKNSFFCFFENKEREKNFFYKIEKTLTRTYR